MSTAPDYREQIKNALLKRLYQKQFTYWRDRLIALSIINSQSLDHPVSQQITDVSFKGKKYKISNLSWTQEYKSGYCSLLNEDFPSFVQEMEIIAEAYTELMDEKYEIGRFLSGLVLFNAPLGNLKEILGFSLYSAIPQLLLYRYTSEPTGNWNTNGEYSINTYISKNKELIKKMNQRIMLNIVTVD